LRRKPTVSERTIARPPTPWRRAWRASSVAKRRSSANSFEEVSRLKSVVYPAFV